MKKVACYCRVSTEEQAKFGLSISAQKTALENFCTENKLKADYFIDEGISASSIKRPELQKMLSNITQYSMVLFTKLDRLSRNVLDANNINKILQQNNVTMKAIDEDDIDTSTADGTFMFNLKVSLAQREIGKTSERINFVFKDKRLKGEVTSGSKKYGYNVIDKHYVINEQQAENIRNLYKYYINVSGNIPKTYEYMLTIIPNKSMDTLYRYLRDTAYIGKYKLYRKEIYLDNYIPRIMDDELFYKVQTLHTKKERNYTKSNRISLFADLGYCNICNKKMSKKIDYRTKDTVYLCCWNYYKRKPGSIKRYCTNHKLIKESIIEQYLLNNLEVLAKNYSIKLKKLSEKKIDNSKEIEIINKKITKLKTLFLNDLIDIETYKMDYNNYISQLNLLEKKNIDKPSNINHIIKNTNIINVYNKLSLENKKKFWFSIIDKIYIEDKKVKEVIFK